MIRVTEQPHPLTTRLDEAGSEQLARLLINCEAEVFGSEAFGPGLMADEVLEAVLALRKAIAAIRPRGEVVLGGAGTSGRLALHAAAKHPQVRGLLAGGLDAFFQAKERIEDQPAAGVADMIAANLKKGRFVYVGISCGLSAAYVAAQAQWALDNGAAAVGIIGFNPLQAASHREAPGLPGGFAAVAQAVADDPRGVLLNPSIGPEAIAGSTRLKGGSATKILLESILNPVHATESLLLFRQLHRCFTDHAQRFAADIDIAAQALAQGGSIRYLAGADDGLIAMLDASEVPPTFGADPDECQAYVDPHIQELMPGLDLTSRCSHDLQLSEADALFVIGEDADHHAAARSIKADPVLWCDLQPPPSLQDACRDLWLKWRLNLISTGAYVQRGKVYGNRMIDLKISNAKLYDRAVRMIAELAETTKAKAESAMAMVVLGEPTADDSQILNKAGGVRNVVTTSVLVARGHTPQAARDSLTRTPKLKDCLRAL